MSSEDWCSKAEALEDWAEFEEDIEDVLERYVAPPSRKGSDSIITKMIQLYDLAQAARIHATIQCPCCKKMHTKTTYHKVFCSNDKTKGRGNCKDYYWNTVNPARAARQQRFAGTKRKNK